MDPVHAPLEKVTRVSRETLEHLADYEKLVRKWNPAINLVAPSTVNDIWQRHFLESAQLFEFARPGTGTWLDMGSGGGFPGGVVAVLAAEIAPELKVTCIESDIRKCEFLRTVSRTTGVPFGVISRRIEETPRQAARYVSARALSSLDKLLSHTERHLHSDGEALFLKGETWQTEVAEARKNWTFDMETTPSLTNPGSALLKLRNIVRA